MLNVTNLSTLNIAVYTPTAVACHLSPFVPPTTSCSSTTKKLLGHFCDKSLFYRFFLHQTQSKRDGNVPVLDVPVRPVRRLGRWAMLAIHEHPQILIPLCCSRISGSPQTRTDSVRTLLVSLIHNSPFRYTEQNGTEPPSNSRSSLRRCRYKSACFFSWA